MIFFKNTASPNSDKTVYFEAFEDENLIGRCTLILEDKYANVCELTFDALYAGEGLLKSAYNYACLKNYYMGKCSVQNVDSLLLKLGFYKKDGVYENDIPSILMGSCGCHNK